MKNNKYNDHKDFKTGTIYIFTDGACKGNPGPGGYGMVFYLDKGEGGDPSIKKMSAGYQLTTNNRMELMACVNALDHLKARNEGNKKFNIVIISDSKYVVKAVKEKWIDRWIKKKWKTTSRKPVENQDLWKRLLVHLDRHDIVFEWVKGHAGHRFNEECDKLASLAAAGNNLKEDTGYLNS